MRRTRRTAGAATLMAALVLVLSAHATVHPGVSPPGAYERYLLRVPNERDRPTVRVQLDFPPGVRVVSFADVPGWRLEVEEDEEGRVLSAAWSGELPVRRFVEFPFVAVNPPQEGHLSWPVTQTYADGEAVRWDGPEGSATPTSVTRVRSVGETGGGGPALLLSAGALVIGLLGLGLALRPHPSRNLRAGGDSTPGGVSVSES